MSDFELELNRSCEEAVRLITSALERHGLRVVRNFDLHSALKAEVATSTCPNHGTDRCTCNYIVLSVYQVTQVGPSLRLSDQIVIRDHHGNARLSLPVLADTGGALQESAANPRLLAALAEVLSETGMK